MKALSKFIEENLEEKDQKKVRYASTDSIVELLESYGKASPTEAQSVRGYKVKVVRQVLDPDEAQARRSAIAEVIAKSLTKNRKDN